MLVALPLSEDDRAEDSHQNQKGSEFERIDEILEKQHG
jgi:hypothetical protein